MFRLKLNSSNASVTSLDHSNQMSPIKLRAESKLPRGIHSKFSNRYSSMSKPNSSLANHSALSYSYQLPNSRTSLRSTPDPRHLKHTIDNNTSKASVINKVSIPTNIPSNVSSLNEYLTECSKQIDDRTNLVQFKASVSEIDDDYQVYSEQRISCNCVICNKKANMAYYEKNLAPVIDTKNFIDCLNDVRPSVVLDRGNDHCEMIQEINRSHKKDNKRVIKSSKGTRKAHSRIELWKEKEVINLIKPTLDTSSNNNAFSNSKSTSIRGSAKDLNAAEHNKNRLIKIFREFKLDPYLSPLINQLQNHSQMMLNESMNNSMDQTEKYYRQQSTTPHFYRQLKQKPPSTPQFYRKNLPANPPVTPLMY